MKSVENKKIFNSSNDWFEMKSQCSFRHVLFGFPVNKTQVKEREKKVRSIKITVHAHTHTRISSE